MYSMAPADWTLFNQRDVIVLFLGPKEVAFNFRALKNDSLIFSQRGVFFVCFFFSREGFILVVETVTVLILGSKVYSRYFGAKKGGVLFYHSRRGRFIFRQRWVVRGAFNKFPDFFLYKHLKLS